MRRTVRSGRSVLAMLAVALCAGGIRAANSARPMPDLIGMSINDAKAALADFTEVHWVNGALDPLSDPAKACEGTQGTVGFVAWQWPQASVTVESGSKLSVVLSCETVVRDYKRLGAAVAKEWARRGGLLLKRVDAQGNELPWPTEENAWCVEKNQDSSKIGRRINAGDKVGVILIQIPQPDPPPDDDGDGDDGGGLRHGAAGLAGAITIATIVIGVRRRRRRSG